MTINNIIHNKLLRSTFIYTLTDGLNKALGFLLIPWVSFYLIPEELGIVTNFQVLQNILLLLAGQAIVNSLPYFFYNRSKKEVGTFIFNLLFLIIITNAFFVLLIFFLFNHIESVLQIGLPFQLLTIVNVICTLITTLNMTLFRLEEKPLQFAFWQTLQIILNVSLVILFVIVLKWGAIGKIYSLVITSSVTGLINMVLLIKQKYIVFKISRGYLKEILKFGIPLLPHSLSFWIKSGVDKIVITTYCGLTQNGIFSMALSIGAVFSLFSAAFNNAYCPYLQKRMNLFTQESVVDEKRKIVKQAYLLGMGYVFLGVFSFLFIWLCFHYFIDKQYIESIGYMPWIIAGQIFTGFYHLVIQYVYFAKKTIGLGIITFSCSVLQILFTFIFIQLYGTIGAAYSTCLGALITFVLVWIYSNHVYDMPWFYFIKRKWSLIRNDWS
ncbi:polysaccharide biosynthesis protein [Spirochaetia bacterium]|nr:polysaccharide biosynthesis protein [Spirochaetia bacterium]